MEWIDVIVKIVFLVLSTAITVYVVPWLKEKKLYDIVVKLVKAAEKLAENGKFDKKAWVIDRLVMMGITITPAVDALIECAVKELDIALGKIQ